MDRNSYAFSLLFIALLSVSGGVTQEQNIEETVDYLNEVIEEDDKYGDRKDNLEFEVDEKGMLTAQYYWGTYKAFKHTMKLKSLDKGKVERDTSTIYDRDVIRLYCEENDHCIKKESNHKRETREKGKYEFSITKKDGAGRRMRNAFVHLIERAESRFADQENGKKEDDPYDY